MTDDQYRRLFLYPAEMPVVSADFVRTEVVPRVAERLEEAEEENTFATLEPRELRAMVDYIEGRCKTDDPRATCEPRVMFKDGWVK